MDKDTMYRVAAILTNGLPHQQSAKSAVEKYFEVTHRTATGVSGARHARVDGFGR